MRNVKYVAAKSKWANNRGGKAFRLQIGRALRRKRCLCLNADRAAKSCLCTSWSRKTVTTWGSSWGNQTLCCAADTSLENKSVANPEQRLASTAFDELLRGSIKMGAQFSVHSSQWPRVV